MSGFCEEQPFVGIGIKGIRRLKNKKMKKMKKISRVKITN